VGTRLSQEEWEEIGLRLEGKDIFYVDAAVSVIYNPYKNSTFVCADGNSILKAKYVSISQNLIIALNPK